jgi:ribosomal protein S18 acetylase RimI-like enzyme
MEYIQTDVSDDALATAARANMCDFFRHLSRSDSSENFENERFTRWHTPLPHPWFNGVLCSRPPDEMDVAFIEETLHYFHTKKVDKFTWWLEPPLKSSEWKSVLSRYDFGFSISAPGMAVNLNELVLTEPPASDFEIRSVEDEESLEVWVETFLRGYGLPREWASNTLDLWTELGLDFPMRNYLGFLNGKPVTTSSVFYGSGVAGIYSVSTLAEERGKGLGAAITLRPLKEAREMGYQIGILQSTQMGLNVYKKLGFKQVCQIENFYKQNK